MVDAGPDATVKLGAGAWLRGRACNGTGTPLTYKWTNVSGPIKPALLQPTSPTCQASFNGVAGVYVFQLQVSDGTLLNTDTVTVTMTK